MSDEIKDPYAANTELQELQSRCEDVLQTKNELIDSLETRLSQKDEEYARTLRNQAAEIKTITEQMRKTFIEMRVNYDKELEDLEEQFMQDRRETLKRDKAALDAVVEERRALEVDLIERRQKMIEGYHEKIDASRQRDLEAYQVLKMGKEREAATLEQQLEDMRATYQLNAEKLEYNYRVLNERDIETSSLISQNKRKIGRLGDLLAKAVAAHEKTEKQHRTENEQLTADYVKQTEKYRQLEVKFKQGEGTAANEFKESWTMHQKQFIKRIMSLVIGDQIVHRDILGRKWEPPEEFVARLRELGLAGQLAEALQNLGGTTGVAGTADTSWLTDGEGVDAAEEDTVTREAAFWGRLAEIYPERGRKLWLAVETGLTELHGVVKERTRLYEANTAIAAQNEELRALLQQYLGNEVNEQLIIPPARIVHEEAGPAEVVAGQGARVRQ